LIVGWCGQFLIFVVVHQFSQVVGEWLENQILIPDWTCFYCPCTTLVGEWPGNQILIPNWTNFHCHDTTLATRQCLVKIDEGQQKIKIIRTNQQSNLRGSCQSIFSLCLTNLFEIP